MKRYEKYKDSGVKWIGEIPVQWEIARGKRLFQEQKRNIREQDEIVTCFRDGQVTLRRLRKTEGFTNSLKEIGYQGIRKGDLVVHNMDAFAGAIGIAEYDGKSTPVYSVCTERVLGTLDLKFYGYYLRNLALRGLILSLAKGIRERSTDFRFSDLGNLELPLPSLPEQQTIVAFLDEKIAKVDQTIAIKQKEIELLKERRQILIQKIVTKGLDDGVKMKYSGVEWIGEIPAHWEVRKLKYLLDELNIRSSTGKEELLSLSKYSGVIPKSSLEDRAGGAESHIGYKIVRKYDMVINKMQAVNGLLSVSKIPGITSPDYSIYFSKNKNKLNIFYLQYLLLQNEYLSEFKKRVTGVMEGFIRLYTDELYDIKVQLPKIEEQNEIVFYVKKIEEKIAKAISLKQKEIEKLKEYKMVLIDNVVTGKVKVG